MEETGGLASYRPNPNNLAEDAERREALPIIKAGAGSYLGNPIRPLI